MGLAVLALAFDRAVKRHLAAATEAQARRGVASLADVRHCQKRDESRRVATINCKLEIGGVVNGKTVWRFLFIVNQKVESLSLRSSVPFKESDSAGVT